MTVDEAHSEVLRILRSVLKKSRIDGLALREEISEWDSLKHLEIIFSVEDAFSVEFGEEELAGFSSSLMIAEAAVAKKDSDGAS